MLKQNWTADIDRLSVTVNNLQKCLECTICLELMTAPVKTRCGHSFCQLCIGKILNKKTAHCPLCKKSLKRRSVSKDTHLETCIQKFKNLVTAIQIDTHVDILSYTKQPRDTRESCLNSDSSQSNNNNERKQPKKQSIRQLNQSNPQADRSSMTNSRTAIECDNALDTDFKVRTWIHSFPDKFIDTPAYQSEIMPIDHHIFDGDNKPNTTDGIYGDKDDESGGAIQIKEEDTAASGLKYKAIHSRVRAKVARNRKKFVESRESNVEMISTQNSALSTTVRDRTLPNDASTSLSSVANKQSSADTTWSRVIKVGKEMRAKKSKVKKLNVSTEKNKNTPRIVEDVMLTPSSKYNASKSTVNCNRSNREADASNPPQESSSQKQDTFDKSLNLSSAKITASEAMNETSIRNVYREYGRSMTEVNCATEASYITLKEGSRMRIENLDNLQMKEIIGFADDSQLVDVSQKARHFEENADIITEHRDSPLLRSKRLTILTPEKLNKSYESKTINDVAIPLTPTNYIASSPRLQADNQTPEHRVNNSSVKRSGSIAAQSQSSTPNRARLSLRRNLEINKNDESPLLSDLSLIDRQSGEGKGQVTSDRKSVDSPVSKDGPLFDRLVAVRRDLNPQILGEYQVQAGQSTTVAGAFPERRGETENNDENVSGVACQDEKLIVRSMASRQSTSIKSQTSGNEGCRFPVCKFMQLSTMIRRRNVRYLYLNPTRCERLMPAVYNIQQSISRSEIERQQNLAMSSSPSNDSQDTTNITVIENIRFVDNLAANSDTVPENIEVLSTIFPTSNSDFAVSATPKRDIDHRKGIASIERCSMNTSPRSSRTIQDAGKKAQPLCKRSRTGGSAIEKRILHAHSSTTNAIKLLPADEDSQLKFLDIDSPVSQHAESRPASSMRQRSELGKSATEESKFPEVKDSRFAASAGKTREALSSESSGSTFRLQSGRKRKRIRRTGDKELSEGDSMYAHRNDGSSNSASDASRRTIKYDKYRKATNDNDANSDTDTNKKRRLNSSHDHDGEVIRLGSKEEDAQGRKFKRIMPMSSSDTGSESSAHAAKNWKSKRGDQYDENSPSTSTLKERYLLRRDSDEDLRIRSIVDKWSNEHSAIPKGLINESRDNQNSNKSMKCSAEVRTASRSSHSVNTPEAEKRKGTKSSQKSSEPALFSSNSIFNSVDLDVIVAQQSTKTNRGKASQNSVDPFNDDIINKVLQIDRSHNNSDGTVDSAARNNGTNRRDKAHKELVLLQDNFDEIIANVELPQSDDVIPRIEQTNRNLDRTLTEQCTSDRSTMVDESCDVARQVSTIPIVHQSSTNDIFEHRAYSDRDVKKSSSDIPTSVISTNSNGRNVVPYGQRKQNHAEDRRDRENVTARNFADAIDKDSSRRRITSKDNAPHEKGKSFDRVDPDDALPTVAEINVSTRLPGQLCVNGDEVPRETAAGDGESSLKNNSSEYDTLMNITQQQINLQMFEEDLFGVAAIRDRTKTAKMTLQDDPPREEQRTPTRRKRSDRNENTALEEHSTEDDDVVENTPETKRKNSGSSVKTIGSSTKRNIAMLYVSPIGPPPSKKAIPRSDTSTPMSRYAMYPLYQSTPKVTSDVASTSRTDASTESKGIGRSMGVGVPLVKQIRSKARLCFVCSGLTAAQIAYVKEFARKYNANHVNQFDPRVTHVIVSTTGDDNVAKSTLKYLQGIAHRKWIVSYKWIVDCVREGRLLDEISYEATTYNDGITGAGPRNSRLRDKGIFEGFAFLCVGPYNDVSSSQYQDLLLASGATVVDSIEALAAEKEGWKGVLIQDNIHDEKKIEYWYRTARAAPIVTDWIVECITQYKRLLLSPYIPNLSPQDLCAIGYPRELVEEEDEYSDAST